MTDDAVSSRSTATPMAQFDSQTEMEPPIAPFVTRVYEANSIYQKDQ